MITTEEKNEQPFTIEGVMHRALPCPFCGSQPKLGREYSGAGYSACYGVYSYHLECGKCEIEFGYESIREDKVTKEKEIEFASKFVDRWNVRHGK